MPRGGSGKKDNGYIITTPKKYVKRVSQSQFEKGDPDFVDERKVTSKEPESSLLDSFFK
jgi:hypothetical protein